MSLDDDVGQDLLPAGGSEEGSERLSVKDVEEMFNLPVLGHTTSEGRYAARLRRKGRVHLKMTLFKIQSFWIYSEISIKPKKL